MFNFFFYNLNKRLCFGLLNGGGRNHLGRVVVKGRGGGLKRSYRKIDFFRRANQYGRVFRVLFDNARSAFLAFVLYRNGLCGLIIMSHKSSSLVYSGTCSKTIGDKAHLGWAVPLSAIKVLTTISNIEFKPYKGAKLVRAAGTSALLSSKDTEKAVVKLRSGWLLNFPLRSIATIGQVSNPLNNQRIIGKAGLRRLAGFRPKVRGVAKNPVDHPHGGGNGKKPSPVWPSNFTGKFRKWCPSKKDNVHQLKRKLFFKKKLKRK